MVTEVTIISIEEKNMIFDRVGAAYIGELGRGLKLYVSINVAIWYVMDCPVQWDVVMDILGVLLVLVNK